MSETRASLPFGCTSSSAAHGTPTRPSRHRTSGTSHWMASSSSPEIGNDRFTRSVSAVHADRNTFLSGRIRSERNSRSSNRAICPNAQMTTRTSSSAISCRTRPDFSILRIPRTCTRKTGWSFAVTRFGSSPISAPTDLSAFGSIREAPFLRMACPHGSSRGPFDFACIRIATPTTTAAFAVT